MRKIRGRIRPPSPSTVISLIALVLAMGGGGYVALGATTPATKTGAKFYGPGEYRPGDSNVGYASAGLGQRACTSSPNVEGSADFSIPFDNIPDGATITKVTAYYDDWDANQQLTFQVFSSTPGVSDIVDGFSPETSSDSTGTVGAVESPSNVDMTPTQPVVVDNANRRYGIAASFSACGTEVTGSEGSFPSLVLDGVRVEYRLK